MGEKTDHGRRGCYEISPGHRRWSGSPHESELIDEGLAAASLNELPKRLVGDKGKLNRKIMANRQIFRFNFPLPAVLWP